MTINPERDQPTREDLIAICERAVVPVTQWHDRDTPRSQERVGQAWALLKAGCEWRIAEEMYTGRANEHTIWIYITYPGFGTFDWGAPHEDELFYLPTASRLDENSGSDWY